MPNAPKMRALRQEEVIRLRRRIADYIIYSQVQDFVLGEKHSDRELQPGKVEFSENIQYLEGKGCDRRLIHVILNMGKAFQVKRWGDSAPRVKTVKATVKKIRRFVKEMRAIDWDDLSTISMQTSMSKSEIFTLPPGADTTFVRMPGFAPLEKLASMLEEWSALSAQNALPKGMPRERLPRICLAMYIKNATGHAHFGKVLTLIRCAGLVTVNDAGQLSREAKEFDDGYPLCGFLLRQFLWLHRDKADRECEPPGLPEVYYREHVRRLLREFWGDVHPDHAVSRRKAPAGGKSTS